MSTNPSTPAPVSSSSNGSVTPSTTLYSQSINHEAEAEADHVNGNGHNGHNGQDQVSFNGESSKMAIATSGEKPQPQSPSFHAVHLSNYIFDIGYLHQQWTDVHLTFFSTGLKAHRIIIARSPYLAHLMMNTIPSSTIHLSFIDENITPDAVHIAIQHLYSPAQRLVDSTNARSVLATAYLFGSMPELVHQAYTICRSSITSDTIVDYVHWLSAGANAEEPFESQKQNNNTNGYRDSPAGTIYGSVRVEEGHPTVQGQGVGVGSESGINGGFTTSSTWAEDVNPRYGEWTQRLRHDVVEYLISGLAENLLTENKTFTSDLRIRNIFSELPYHLFKTCIESPNLPISSKQDRFAFAKKIIALRKKLAAAAGATTQVQVQGQGQGQIMEESAVLAFTEDGEMSVQVNRKPKKGRSFFKVEG